MSFIDKYNLLYEYQFGFRKKYSTSMAINMLVDNISHSLQEKKFVLGVFLDLSKAFDTVNHDILLQKLNHYGIRGIAYTWIKSYLNSRVQFVHYNGVNSENLPVTCGVPQGSILGPLLFLLYVNDIVNVSASLMPILFADDTNVFISGHNIHEMCTLLNTELQKIVLWLNSNKLSLNVSKTHYMLFSPHKKCKMKKSTNIVLNGQQITETANTKFLGVMLDNKLKWSVHINTIRIKMSKGIGIICKARTVVNASTLVSLYYSFIYPYLSYCIDVWGSTYDYILHPIIILQKKILRIIASVPRRTPSDFLFKKFNILTVHEMYVFSVAIFMFKWCHKIIPSIFDNFFRRNSEICFYSTRQ